MKGTLISLEGPEGAGKTSQAKAVLEKLNQMGYRGEYIREPGGTVIGEGIRKILLDEQNTGMSYEAEALLYAASRAQLLKEKVLPLLQKTDFVLLDRYIDSSVAYQGHARGLGEDWIRQINAYAYENAMPDLTILLDIPVEKGLNRKNEQNELNRMDKETVRFHEKVREGYLALGKDDARFLILDGDKPFQELNQEIIEEILNILKKRSSQQIL